MEVRPGGTKTRDRNAIGKPESGLFTVSVCHGFFLGLPEFWLFWTVLAKDYRLHTVQTLNQTLTDGTAHFLKDRPQGMSQFAPFCHGEVPWVVSEKSRGTGKLPLWFEHW